MLLCGDGGSGKTTLACQMARWAMAEKEHERLCKKHRMIPVFIEENLPGAQPGNSAALLAEIRGSLKNLIGEEEAPSDDLVKNLLRRRRILLIVDGYSELNEATQQSIRFNDPALNLNALLVTSRSANTLNASNGLTLQTGLLKGQGIAAFVEDYIKQAGKRDLFTDTEFYDELTRFTELVGDREITALLASLYARFMIDSKETPHVERPRNVPELMDVYIAEMCRKADDRSYPARALHALACKVAWACLKETLTPTETPADEVVAALSKTDDGIALPAGQTDSNAVLTFFVEKLRLLQWRGINEQNVKFTLDPLSEYLAACYLVVYGFKADANAWKGFLVEVRHKQGRGSSITGFLRALTDTVAAKGKEAGVPDSVLPRLLAVLGKGSASKHRDASAPPTVMSNKAISVIAEANDTPANAC